MAFSFAQSIGGRRKMACSLEDHDYINVLEIQENLFGNCRV